MLFHRILPCVRAEADFIHAGQQRIAERLKKTQQPSGKRVQRVSVRQPRDLRIQPSTFKEIQNPMGRVYHTRETVVLHLRSNLMLPTAIPTNIVNQEGLAG